MNTINNSPTHIKIVHFSCVCMQSRLYNIICSSVHLRN